MNTLTPEDVKRMLIGGYINVASHKEAVNSINMFPVPDQDTGSNLTRTLRGVYDALNTKTFATMSDLTHEALEGALTAAAGNAGIITTSFLGGLLHLFSDEHINTSTFIQAFALGTDRAFKSVQEPKKGTILDVMQAVTRHLNSKQADISFVPMLEQIITVSKEALEQTQKHMAVYKKARVVDAGGLGFVYMLQGFLYGIQNQSIATQELTESTYTHKKPLIEITSRQFEVVGIVGDIRIDQSTVMSRLIDHGDSIDIVSVHDKMKIHIHTDHPHTIHTMLSDFGTILHIKTVDMNEGEGAKNEGSIGIITDEGASIPLSYAIEHDIAVVPFQYEWEHIRKHKRLAHLHLYEQMRQVRKSIGYLHAPKTSQPSIYTFLKTFKDHLQKYEHVVCLTTSSRVSGTFNSALQAREQLSQAHKSRVFIPDLQQALPGHALLVHQAVACVQNRCSISELVNSLQKTAERVDVFGFGSDAYWLAKGGRLGTRKARALTMLLALGIQPVVGVKNGKLGVRGFVKRRESLAEMAFRYIKDTYGDGKKYDVIVHHADNPAELKQLTKYLEGTSFSLIQDSLLSPVAGIHIGPDALIVGVLAK